MKKSRSGRSKMPKETVIRQYWSNKIDIEKKGFDSVDEFLEEGLCFACGIYTDGIHRCHILARSKGGSDDASNLHMLCEPCHDDSDRIDGDVYWKWFYERTMLDGIVSRALKLGLNPFVTLIESNNLAKDKLFAGIYKSERFIIDEAHKSFGHIFDSR